MRASIPTLFAIVLALNALPAQQKKHAPKASDKPNILNETEAFSGYFNFNYSPKKDAIYLTVKNTDQPFLYVNSLSQGIGNNDLGLDRGQLGNERLLVFKKAGNKLLLLQPNLAYRARSDNALEQRSITEAFGKSVLFGFPIEASTADGYIIDLTPFLMQDAHGVAKRLQQAQQGTFKVDATRSAIALNRTKAFPKNIELDVLLTFTGEANGNMLRGVVPTPDAVTVYQHHSFVELPDNNYQMRSFDPRSGLNVFSYYDYATPVSASTLQQFIYRHRLEKKDPTAAVSEAVEPLVYYLDNGTPEPVRSALLEGGSWWNQAFEQIGYKNAFQIKMLPDDADPLDVRYNVIQWVHRSTRGWSYGSSVADPRTGEIIKGHVSLGSLRIRQDYLIALGLTEKPFAENSIVNASAMKLALARIRQLAAHEIGHTLGFAHNFAASPKNRASVMDYPHPTLSLNEGKIDFSNAYATGIGDWDKVSVAYAYSDFPAGVDETNALIQIIEKSISEGHRFISDNDARPPGGAHPTAHLWDNGADAIAELEQLLQIRQLALKNFSTDHLRVGEPYTLLEDRLVPIYLLHRYQAEAVVKLVGGLDYDYGVKGVHTYKTTPVDPKTQRQALEIFLNLLTPEALQFPESIRSFLLPRSPGAPRSRENFLSQTGVAFDFLGAGNSLSDALLGLLLHPQRASRLIQQQGFEEEQIGLKTVLQRLIDKTFKQNDPKAHAQQLSEIVKLNTLKQLMELGQNQQANPLVSMEVFDALEHLDRWLTNNRDTANNNYYISLIHRYFDNPAEFTPPDSERLPDGSPIGSFSCDF